MRFPRDEAVTIVVHAAQLSGKKLFGVDDLGNTQEIAVNRRDSFRRDGTQNRVKGAVDVPENLTHLCVEGDTCWQRLPHPVTTEQLKLTESARRKSAARGKPARSVPHS